MLLDVPKLLRDSVTIMPGVQLQALMVVPSGDVDLRVWNATVAHLEKRGHHVTEDLRL